MDAVRFHGHLGPFLVLGLRAGLAAISFLGRDPFKTKAVVRTKLRPPHSCFIDGIQFSSGCTLGKGNIQVERENEVSVCFYNEGRQARIKVKEEALRLLEQGLSESEAEALALDMCKRDERELFEIKFGEEGAGRA